MSINTLISRFLPVALVGFLLGFAVPSEAHNGATALALPLEGIVVDSDFSDWPDDLTQYPLAVLDGDRLQGEGDFEASFRIGYHQAENTLYLAVEVWDESVVSDTTTATAEDDQDGCVIFFAEKHGDENSAIGEYAVRGGRLSETIIAGEGVAVEQRRFGGRWRYEWRLELGAIVGEQIQLGPAMTLGLGLQVIDKDEDGSKGRRIWGPNTYRNGDVVLGSSRGEVGALQGMVRWADQEKGIARTKVKFWGGGTGLEGLVETDRAGRFSLELPRGTYGLEAVGLGRNGPAADSVLVEGNGVTEASLVVKGPRGHVEAAGPGKGVWKTFGVLDGLGNELVDAIAVDRRGNLWFGTQGGGVSRYDGGRFTTFTTKDGLADNTVHSLFVDRRGVLWIATLGGVSHYLEPSSPRHGTVGGKFRSFTAEDGLAGNEVYAIAEDHKGDLWFTTEGGVSRYDGNSFTTEDGLVSGSIHRIVADRRGNMWFTTWGDGIIRYDGDTFTTFTTKDGLPSNRFGAVGVDRHGNIWFGTRGAVSRNDGSGFFNLTTADGLIDAGIRSIFADQQGNLWFGTWQEGVVRYDGKTFTTFTIGDGLADNVVRPIVQGPAGYLWFGTFGGASRYDPTYYTIFDSFDALKGGKVHAIAEDRQGNLWFGTLGGGVSRYDGDSFTTFTTKDGLAANVVLSAFADRQGNLWFGTDGGLSRYDGHSFTSFTQADGVVDNSILCIAEDRKGHLWFGGGVFVRFDTKGGVSRYDGDRFTTFTAWDGLPPSRVLSIAADQKGYLWFATDVGVSRYHPEGLANGKDLSVGAGFVNFTAEDGLVPGSVQSIVEDQRGNLWFGTWGDGIGRYTPDGSSNGKGLPAGGGFVNFTVEDGLTPQHHTSRWDDGGSGRSLVGWYDGGRPEPLRRPSVPNCTCWGWSSQQYGRSFIRGPQWPYLDRHPQGDCPLSAVFDAAVGVYRGGGGRSPLRCRQRGATVIGGGFDRFRVCGVSLKTRAGAMVYRCRLRGFDEGWRSTRQRRVEYQDVPVGKYTFEVEAVDRDLDYSPEPATLDLEVYTQTFTSPLRLGKITLDDLFVSFYPTYAQEPLGTVEVVNESTEPREITLHCNLPDLLRQPFAEQVLLPPHSSREIALHLALDPAIVQLQGTLSVRAEVELEFAQGEQIAAFKGDPELTVHGRGALRWDQVGRAAAFITPKDARVAAFARPGLVAFEEQIKAYGRPLANLTRAMVLFEALKAHGLRYLADANSPYAKASADQQAVDHIQYPAELLQSKSGDCDDLTVLYASLLENAGIATALVDYPGHIFLLFDVGIQEYEGYKLPLAPDQYVVRGDRIWLPVEITALDQPFAKAWQQGLDQLNQLSDRDRRRLVVETTDAWERYLPTNPIFEGTVEPPQLQGYEKELLAQYALLEKQLEIYIADRYTYPLKAEPSNEQLRSELGKLYIALEQYGTAIKAAYQYLRSTGGETAATYNHLGIAYYFNGELDQAAFYLQKAFELAPREQGIQQNLTLVKKRLGEVGAGVKASIAPAAKAVETKGQADAVDEDSFYWME